MVKATDSDSVIFKVRILVAQVLKKRNPISRKSGTEILFFIEDENQFRACLKITFLRSFSPGLTSFPAGVFDWVFARFCLTAALGFCL